jgi:hypothetical protein
MRHEGRGTYKAGVLDGKFSDTENPGGLRVGEFRGWQVNSQGRLCGQLRWWSRDNSAIGAGAGFDCYSREPKK